MPKKDKSINRRDFLKKSAIIGAGMLIVPSAVVNCLEKETSPTKTSTNQAKSYSNQAKLSPISIVKGERPSLMTEKAVELLGGMSMFVEKGDIVLVKPNIGWAQKEEMGANTNPEVVSKVVEMCFKAGAGYVYVADMSCNDCKTSYDKSGIEKAAKKAGADVFIPSSNDFVKKNVGDVVGNMDVLKLAFDVDKIINVPIAKHHSLAKLTICMKNLMGLLGSSRRYIHQSMEKKLPELAKFFKPVLNIVDAYRVMIKNGPSGGRTSDVVFKNTVIASQDIVAADTLAAELFTDIKDEKGNYVLIFEDFNPLSLKYITIAESLGLGTSDKSKMDIREASV